MSYRLRLLPLCIAFASLVTVSAHAGDTQDVVRNRSIGYVMTNREWAVYTTAARTECPHGINAVGPREWFKAQFPNDGTTRTYLDTAMTFEAEVWAPSGKADRRFPLYQAEGNISYGLNLDGKIGRNDFTSPEGEKGIDNQLYRAIGCLVAYRDPGALNTSKYMQDFNFSRVVIEITGVDSLTNDDDVTLTTYRGLDSLTVDAGGSGFLPRGTERVDERFGKELIQHFHGRIKNGILETEAADVSFAMTWGLSDVTSFTIRGLRWRLKLTPDSAEGIMAGYADVDNFYFFLNKVLTTHLQTYYQLSSLALYPTLRQLADGYPDPKTGRNTAISSALTVKMKQVFIQHAAQETASNDGEHQEARQTKAEASAAQ